MAQDRTDAELTQSEPGQSDAEDDGSGRRRPSTIIDVANEAGVAIGTVSRYLNGLPVRRGNRDQIETGDQRPRLSPQCARRRDEDRSHQHRRLHGSRAQRVPLRRCSSS